MVLWKRPRYESWASNRNTATFALAVIYLTWLIWEIVGSAPTVLQNLLGPITGIWFGAVTSDQYIRNRTQVTKKAEKEENDDPKSD